MPINGINTLYWILHNNAWHNALLLCKNRVYLSTQLSCNAPATVSSISTQLNSWVKQEQKVYAWVHTNKKHQHDFTKITPSKEPPHGLSITVANEPIGQRILSLAEVYTVDSHEDALYRIEANESLWAISKCSSLQIVPGLITFHISPRCMYKQIHMIPCRSTKASLSL